MLAWIKAHPWETVGLIAVVVATFANVLLRHLGDSSPRLARALRVLIDLIAALPAKGSPSRGLQVPGLSLSAPPPGDRSGDPVTAPVTRGRDPRDDARPAGYVRLPLLCALALLGVLLAWGCSGCATTDALGKAAVDGGRAVLEAGRCTIERSMRHCAQPCKRCVGDQAVRCVLRLPDVAPAQPASQPTVKP